MTEQERLTEQILSLRRNNRIVAAHDAALGALIGSRSSTEEEEAVLRALSTAYQPRDDAWARAYTFPATEVVHEAERHDGVPPLAARFAKRINECAAEGDAREALTFGLAAAVVFAEFGSTAFARRSVLGVSVRRNASCRSPRRRAE